MESNNAFEEAKKDFKGIKKPEDALKLAWYYPLIAAVLLLIITTVLHAFAWWAIGVGIVLTVIIAILQSQGKPSPIKVEWYWILLPTVALAVLLAVPGLSGWIIGLLFLWAAIAALVKYKPWAN